MKKLREYILKWLQGEKIKGIDLSLTDIYNCVCIYNEMVNKEKPEFISGKVKEVLDRCNIKTVKCGIGWKIA